MKLEELIQKVKNGKDAEQDIAEEDLQAFNFTSMNFFAKVCDKLFTRLQKDFEKFKDVCKYCNGRNETIRSASTTESHETCDSPKIIFSCNAERISLDYILKDPVHVLVVLYANGNFDIGLWGYGFRSRDFVELVSFMVTNLDDVEFYLNQKLSQLCSGAAARIAPYIKLLAEDAA